MERNPEFGAVIASLVRLAGLDDVVKVEIGSSDASIKRLHATGVLKHIDLVFLDHYKPAYTTDLKLCEELDLVGPGTVMAADNVIKPGNPPYLEYVRSSVEEKRTAASKGGSGDAPDARFAARQVAQYAKREGQEKVAALRGNPNLVYKSELVNSFEPTGDPVSADIEANGDGHADRDRMVSRSLVAQASRHEGLGIGEDARPALIAGSDYKDVFDRMETMEMKDKSTSMMAV